MFFARSNGLRDGPKSGLSQTPRKPSTGLLVLPTQDPPGALDALGEDAVEVGDVVLERAHAAERARPAGLEVEEVLHGGRDAVQRPELGT